MTENIKSLVYSVSQRHAENLGFVFDNGELVLYRGQQKSVIVPDSVEGVPTVSVNTYAFEDSAVEEVTFGLVPVILINNGLLISNTLKTLTVPRCIVSKRDYRLSKLESPTYTLRSGEVGGADTEGVLIDSSLLSGSGFNIDLISSICENDVEVNGKTYFRFELGGKSLLVYKNHIADYILYDSSHIRLLDEETLEREVYQVDEVLNSLIYAINKALISNVG